ncbi:MAG: 50S ribosomal protein L21e [Candidatus Woesearchaeota archaeon]
MTKRIGKGRKGTRHIYRKKPALRGKVPIRKFMQKFAVGDKVMLKLDPFYQKGVYFPRVHCKVGVVKGSTGRCYRVEISDRKKQKIFIVNPVHLKKV